PQRLREGGCFAEVDRFSHLVIYTAFRCLIAGGAALWSRHDNSENLLFREADFRQPGDSKLWPELLSLADPIATALAGHLLVGGQRPIDQVPLLPDLLADGKAAPLSSEQLDLVRELIPAARSAPTLAAPAPDWLTDAVSRPRPRATRVVPAADD